ncbi:fused MFS/spermidine synthase [Aureliella helgolandensis]|uniref:fused MFS/spermidine synthase n=1 Tax=Aureliella helgolandensis TaxID=2527968 RepID=UPI0018D111E5|nr:fused MFS/spermidine synthase [Aureliella helgolandensis]
MIAYYCIFFFSGLAALVYEVSWNRQLGVLFGHTSHTAAVVLTAYFGGMAIGYALGGKLANRINPFRGYAVCEILAGGWALLVPSLLSFATTGNLAPWLQHDLPLVQMLVRLLASGLLLAPATIALGATLPLMSEMLSRRADDALLELHAARFTTAYAFNTLGALSGVFLAASWLLPSVGVASSSMFAASVSALCGGAAWLYGKGQVAPAHVRRQSGISSPTGAQFPAQPGGVCSTGGEPVSMSFWWIVVGISGGATLALEVLYARLFTLVFHNSTYTFSFVLITFLLGLSLGALVARYLALRFAIMSIACWASSLAALSVSLSVIGFVYGTQLQYFQYGSTFASYYLGGLLLVGGVCLPVATCLGMLLPLAWRQARQFGEWQSQFIGWATAVSTLSAAGGAVMASFLLFPTFGLWWSFGCIALLLLLPTLYATQQRKMGSAIYAATLAGVVAMLPIFFSNPESWTASAGYESLLARWHSTYGWIDVIEDNRTGAKKVRQNLHYRFGATGFNSEREFRQAHLPLLLHPQPENALFIGLGTGMTAAGAVPHRELQAIEIVELIPEVVDAVRLLGKENRHIVDDPRTQMHVGDGRHFLASTPTKFDVIISDLFVPWESETGYLYTLEHFQTTQKCLRPGGVFCQWLPLYQMGIPEFESIADSLRRVFPHVTLWWGRLHPTRPILALVASEEPLDFNFQLLDERLQDLQATGEFSDSQLRSAISLAELFAGDWPLRNQVTLNTDEHPWVEFRSPISHRSGQLFQGPRLREYLLHQLEQNSADSVRFSSDTASGAEVRPRAWQRTVMFPQP